MELGGGSESATKNQTLSSADAAAGEDRLSALPDDVLVLILRKLGTFAAAQTSVLSHRWRRVWALLPVLRFCKPPEPHHLRDALDGHEVLLRELIVLADGATAESLVVWLPAAARRVSGILALVTLGSVEDVEDDNDSEEEEEEEEEEEDHDSEEEEEEEEEEEAAQRGALEAAQRGAFEFPCFEQATKIIIRLGYQGLTMPVTGVFARLTELTLRHVWFHGPGELGDAVSSPRCPCLQSLTVEDVRGLRNLTIHSESMLWMKLRNLRTLSQLTVVAPGLKDLIIEESCFAKSDPIANISAPLLSNFVWTDDFDPSFVHLGKMAHLQCLTVQNYYAYGPIFGFLYNESCLSLLQRFACIKSLLLTLVYPRDIENYDYLMKHMKVLPDTAFLYLILTTNGHAFGASAFHVLRLCTGIRRLKLELSNTVSEAQTVCTSDCKCLQLIEWETEELLLNHLEEVEISGWRGTEHEVAFVKRLFDWGTELKEMRVNFHDSITEVNAKDLYQAFQIFSRPGVCMEFYRYEHFLKVLYAPKD